MMRRKDIQKHCTFADPTLSMLVQYLFSLLTEPRQEVPDHRSSAPGAETGDAVGDVAATWRRRGDTPPSLGEIQR